MRLLLLKCKTPHIFHVLIWYFSVECGITEVICVNWLWYACGSQRDQCYRQYRRAWAHNI